jgi:hypothetical protein
MMVNPDYDDEERLHKLERQWRASEREKVLDEVDARIDKLLSFAISRGIRIGLEEAKGEVVIVRQSKDGE